MGEELHIGKSSAGWTFSFQAHQEPYIHSASDWKAEFRNGGQIFDEYGEELSEKEFWKMVGAKKKEKHNHAREYPNNCWVDREGNSFSLYDFS